MIVVVGWITVPLADRSTTGTGGCFLAAAQAGKAIAETRATPTLTTPTKRNEFAQPICPRLPVTAI
jgi:hypothetical protein